MNRKMQNQTMSGARAPQTVKIEKTSSVAVKATRRPITSAMEPQTKAPTAMPIRFAVPIHAACAGARFQWSESSGMSTPLSVTSQASNMKPRPPITKIFPWTFQRQGRSWTIWSPEGRCWVWVMAAFPAGGQSVGADGGAAPGAREGRRGPLGKLYCRCPPIFSRLPAFHGRFARSGPSADRLVLSHPLTLMEICVSLNQLDRVPIRRALISVYDKTGLEELAQGLHAAGVSIVSTGSTASRISAAGVPVTEVSEITGFPECLDGRVKTLHPKVHAGILADRRLEDHVQQLKDLEVEPFDLVVVNLYPFVQTVKSGASQDEVVEQIDIGGPSMVRAAAKNHPSVAV